MTLKRIGLAVAGLLMGFGIFSASASAATGPVMGAGTYFNNSGDTGHGAPALWAKDSFARIIYLSDPTNVSSSYCGGHSNCVKYTATFNDDGQFVTVTGGGQPNGAAHISGTVNGNLAGTGVETFYADVAPNASLVAHDQNNNGQKIEGQTSAWVNEFFPHTVIAGVPHSANVFGVSGLTSYNYTYTSANCTPTQKWVDASFNGDGTGSGAGNITGGSSCHTFSTFR